MKRLYFAHPINTYDTELEHKVETEIRNYFSCKVENPNQLHHQKGYQEWKKACGSGMLYYYNCVLPKTDGGILLPFQDGMIGAGVAGEADWLLSFHKPVYLRTGSYVFRKLDNFPEEKRLTIEETRERIYK